MVRTPPVALVLLMVTFQGSPLGMMFVHAELVPKLTAVMLATPLDTTTVKSAAEQGREFPKYEAVVDPMKWVVPSPQVLVPLFHTWKVAAEADAAPNIAAADTIASNLFLSFDMVHFSDGRRCV
jgi:hypothetical protein